jgi:uroporphyrinogen-III synthase
VTEVVAYRTVTPVNLDQKKVAEIMNAEVDAILFFSPTAVEHFAVVAGKEAFVALQKCVAVTAVGPITASALSQCGVDRIILSADTTVDAVIAALENHFAGAPLVAGANQQ